MLRPLGPLLIFALGFEGAQHRQTLRPSVDGIRSKALRPFGLQYELKDLEDPWRVPVRYTGTPLRPLLIRRRPLGP